MSSTTNTTQPTVARPSDEGLGTEKGKKELLATPDASPDMDCSQFIQWFPVLAYVLLYVAMDVVIASQGKVNEKTGKKEYAYTPGVLVLLSELGKLLVSVVVLLVSHYYMQGPQNEGISSSNSAAEYSALAAPASSARSLCLTFWPYGAMYAIPSFLYMLWNIINYQSLLLVSLSVYSVIYQTAIFFSAGLWVFVFKRPLSWMQWVALVMLSVGVFIVHVKPNFEFDIHLTALWVILQAFISAIAGVSNEYLYKDPAQKSASINQQNIYFYSWGSFFTIVFLLITKGPSIFTPDEFFRGFSDMVFLIIILSITLGLSVSLILKHCNVIIKLYGQSVHSPLEVITAHLVLGTELTAMIIVASLLIAVSTVMYKMGSTNAAPAKPESEKPTEVTVDSSKTN